MTTRAEKLKGIDLQTYLFGGIFFPDNDASRAFEVEPINSFDQFWQITFRDFDTFKQTVLILLDIEMNLTFETPSKEGLDYLYHLGRIKFVPAKILIEELKNEYLFSAS